MKRVAYDLIRNLVEHLGGTMSFYQKGYLHGVWVITIGEKSRVFECTGDESHPELDQLYGPKVKNPKRREDYEHELNQDAEKQLLSLLDISWLPTRGAEALAQIIERTKWRFAWTLART